MSKSNIKKINFKNRLYRYVCLVVLASAYVVSMWYIFK